MGTGLIVFISLVALAIQIIFAVMFANIAESKGYSKTAYVWAGIFFGIIVYIMIAASRDLTMDAKIDSLQKQLAETGTEATTAETDDELPEL